MPAQFRRFSRRVIVASSAHGPWRPTRSLCSSCIDLPPLQASTPSITVWGANTSVGKTLISAGLSASLVSSGSSVSYIKPVQTGFPKDSDSGFVFNKVRHILTHLKSDCKRRVYASHCIHNVSPLVINSQEHSRIHGEVPFSTRKLIDIRNGLYSSEQCKVPFHVKNDLYSFEEALFESNLDVHNGNWSTRSMLSHETPHDASSCFISSTEWSWSRPVSPHVAAAEEGLIVDDSVLLDRVANSLACFQKGCIHSEHRSLAFPTWAIIETAGGIASPGPSGTLQCDLYRPLRLPGILVGDGKLGGISSTIAAYESLSSRGYDVDAIILLDHQLGNECQLRDYLQHRIPVLVLPSLPHDANDELIQWFIQSGRIFSQLQQHLEATHTQKLSRLRDMKKKADQLLWWPFTQHSLVPEEKITVIDARAGDTFTIYKHVRNSEVMMQQFDGCASWWTQGPDIKLQLEISRQIGYAAGRFGHVMLPENVYEPALQCAELLINLIGKGWADRVYYSDNGSTAVEIAIKMAFRKYLHDKNLLAICNSEKESHNLKVIALKGSYHGDTLGAQDAQSPSPYTGFLQQPWYKGRGLFLDAPQIFMLNGKWQVLLPESFHALESGSVLNEIFFESRDDLFDKQRDQSKFADVYKNYVKDGLSSCMDALPAALIIEPVIHGAGGMMLVDPLFQRILITECRERKIPVIFDEVFAGCWRLGVQSCAKYLHSTPDIACYSKLLTGGSIPLAVTLASASVFEAFKGTSKLQALLHGHSYSGHAIGCQAAITSLKWFSNPETNKNLLPCGTRLVELWEPKIVNELSMHPAVQRVISLGTVFAVELKSDASDSGYASMSSQTIVQALREEGIYNRPLGNVIYLMCGPMTSPTKCSKLLCKLSQQLDAFMDSNGCSKSCPVMAC